MRPVTRSRYLALGAVIAVLSAMTGPAGATPTGQPAGGYPPYLADVADPAVTTLAADLNIPIAEAQGRIGWQEPAAQLEQELQQSLGEQFGGLWIDEQGSGRVKIGIVDGAPTLATTQARRAVDRWRLGAVTDFVPVQVSYAQLQRDSVWLAEQTTRANRAGRPELGLELQVQHNRVVLLAPEQAVLSTTQDEVVAAAQKRLGGRLVVEGWLGYIDRQACAWRSGSFNCDRPLRGGVRTSYVRSVPPFDTIPACSTAFNARSRTNDKWYVLTAGHCRPKDWNMYAYQPRTGIQHLIGNVHATEEERGADPEGTDDYAIIRIDNVPGWDPRPWVYVHGSDDTTQDPDYRIRGTSTTPDGTRVCLSGSSTGTDCGPKRGLFGGPGGLAVAAYCSDGGDSGGAVYSNRLARGLHIGVLRSDCQSAVYQGVREAAGELNVYVVTTNNS